MRSVFALFLAIVCFSVSLDQVHAAPSLASISFSHSVREACIARPNTTITEPALWYSTKPPTTTGDLSLELVSTAKPFDPSSGIILTGDKIICPQKYPAGFTILCQGVRKYGKVSFVVDGKVCRDEIVQPYALKGEHRRNSAGAKDFYLLPWPVTVGTSAVVACTEGYFRSPAVKLTFAC
jgi:hypothetical protein